MRRPGPALVLLGLWGVFIAYGTLIPFEFSATGAEAAAKLRAALNRTEPPGRLDAVANVLLFIPWGLLWGGWAVARGRGFVGAILGATLSGLALSLTVEAAQLFAPTRVSSHYDLITNTVGALLGVLAGWPLARYAWPAIAPRIRSELRTRPLMVAAIVAVAGLVFAGLAPFDVSIDLGDLKQAIKQTRVIPFGGRIDGLPGGVEPWSWASDLMIWSLMGGLAGLATREGGRRGPSVVAALAAGAGVIALGVELAQLIVSSRETDMTSVALAMAGAGIGAAVVVANRGNGARRWIGPALGLWLAGVVLAAWTPPQLRADGTWPSVGIAQLVPFWAYYERTGILALADLLTQALAYVPLGALLAAGTRRGRPLVWAVVVGFVIALVLEVGQLFLVDRTAEITDAISAAVGAGAGAWLWGWGVRTLGERTASGHAGYVDGRAMQ